MKKMLFTVLIITIGFRLSFAANPVKVKLGIDVLLEQQLDLLKEKTQ